MNLMTSIRYHFADKAYYAKEKKLKLAMIADLAVEVNRPYPSKLKYRETVFHYHTRRHFLSLNLVRLIKTIKQENNARLAQIIERVVGDFDYKPNANSYCEPMIRLNIQSHSILQPVEEFSAKAVEIEIQNQRLERKINRCCEIIKLYDVKAELLSLVAQLEQEPDTKI